MTEIGNLSYLQEYAATGGVSASSLLSEVGSPSEKSQQVPASSFQASFGVPSGFSASRNVQYQL
jgi:hypothetical protein